MKQFKVPLFFFILFSLFAMNANSQLPVKNYEPSWKKVEEFVKKGLPKSALAEVKNIYALAKKENQSAQVIKALVYMTNLQEENREDNTIVAIQDIEKELPGSKEPVSSILNSLLAQLYWNYYQAHRWNLYDRTQTSVDFKKEDIATWGAEDFHKKVTALYLASLSNEKLLQQTRLPAFDAIIIKGNMRHLRPTLYDLLVHRALSYFENDERDVNRPAYSYEIDQASAFDPAADFITRKFTTKDSLSLQHKALLIYQQLIAFHINDPKPDALIDADLQRIQFVRAKSTHPDKDSLYFNSINHIAHQYENTPAAAQAWYLLAAYHEQNARQYAPNGDTAHQYDYLKAKQIGERLLAQKDSSEGKTNVYNLMNQINQKELRFSLEKVNVPAQAFRALVNYRNIDQLFLRLVKADETLKKQLSDEYGDKYWSSILAARSIRDWQQPLPKTTDLQTHGTEIKIDALPAGEYLLIAGSDKDFTNKKTLVGARLFHVSSISYVNNSDDFFVLDRDNGQPLANAAVQLWEQKYDYTVSKYIKEKGKLYKTDDHGFFHRDAVKQDLSGKRYSNYSYLLDISYKQDRLFLSDLINDYYYYRDNAPRETKPVTSVFLFTDRSIYRPGQLLYFKGIVLTQDNEGRKGDVMTNYETTIYLQDANSQQVDSLKLKTNEYGSFSGKFQLPSGGLNGQFSLLTKKDNGQAYVRVEEYKRPKFYVDYEPLKGTYRVNDTITITGTAKAYAGNNIDGATVSYRVVRQPRFPYPWLFSRWWLPPSTPMEIVHGEMKTDKDGLFKIEFAAIPDNKIDKKMEPTFDYTVYADVTDINGETRSGEKRVSVSYKALLLKTSIPSTLLVDSLKTLSIRTENNNGEFEPANVKVVITKLKQEDRLIRARFWERPDQFVMNREEYIRLFPYDEYDNENDPRTWEKGEKVLEKTDSARINGQYTLDGKLAPGFYVIEMTTKDKNGEEVKDIQYTELYNEADKQLNRPQYLWSEAGKAIEPGEKTTVKLGTGASDLYVIEQIQKKFNSIPGNPSGRNPNDPQNTYSFLKLNNEKKAFDFNATEADRGGYGAGWLFVKNNRAYQYNQVISVPWTNKELNIEYATYRDKTLPGSEEKWTLRISGYKNEKVAAEILASMYDASLDQFSPHSWSQPSVLPYYSGQRDWESFTNFVKADASQKPVTGPEYEALNKQYDYLLYSQYSILGNMPGLQVYKSGGRPGMEMKSMVRNQSVMLRGKASTEQDGEQYLAAALPMVIIPKEDSSIAASAVSQGGDVQIRKNFNETAFFFPDLRTDSSGAIEFSFTLPDALTKWKFQALAHTQDLSFGYSSKEIVTQKQLMVQPNPTRFLREGDKIEFSAKIVNLTDKEFTGTAELQLFDAATNEPVDGRFKSVVPNQYFTVGAGQSEAIQFPIEVPYQFNKALTWRIVAKAGEYSDGEENSLPVLTNRMLVTETLSLPMRGNGTKNFSFDKLLKSGASETLQQYSLTVEYTSNPAWFAVQALPYLMEYPYDCAEQTWNRYYANSLATYISNASPRIKKIFEQWKSTDTAALLSNLQKNQELKAILLEETPWVLQAKSEAEQKKNIALLFDMIKMSGQLNSSFEKLKQLQGPNGGFVWFKGGPDDRYMTQYILTGIGHLKKLGAYAPGQEPKLQSLLSTALPYLDKKIKEDYDQLIKLKTDLKKYTPNNSVVQYLYMRSFFTDYKIAAASQAAYNYFKGRLPLAWTQQNKYMQGMTALTLFRGGDTQTPAAILKSLKETSLNNEELGMYWKDPARSWWWYEAPIERQALLIEAFQEIGKDTKTVDDLRTWLLKNKQTNRWESTKATAEACYALLLQGTQWLDNDPVVQVNLGGTIIRSTDNKQEAGTGYFKTTIDGEKVKPAMGAIGVTVNNASNTSTTQASWGGVYWQYFEDLDKITTASTPLKLVKKLFVEKNSDRGPVLTPVNDGDILKVGDKIRVRIELRVDREMEYVHMKDMRAAAFEPVNVLSGYKWQGGLGYYESTKDASTNFFFGSLRKGTYVFEYPLFVGQAGNFSNGVTSIQCMYAPEFTSHSEGIRVSVE